MAGIFRVGHFPKFGYFKTCKKLQILNFGKNDDRRIMNFEKMGFVKPNLSQPCFCIVVNLALFSVKTTIVVL